MPCVRKLSDVVGWRLCLGCGACAYICPEGRITLSDFMDEGIRPQVSSEDCGTCRLCLDVCPAVQCDFRDDGASKDGFTKEWGPVLAVWEGYATDPTVRYEGSSGGVLTALGNYCIEVLGMHGVLHVGQDPDAPLRNCTRLSRTREQVAAACGSRYSPASVCDGLALVEQAPRHCVIIGKPVEIAAVANARILRPQLEARIGVTFSFFCAEAPATRGTFALLDKLGVDPSQVADLRYRGKGWPGHFAPTLRDCEEPCRMIPYRESWSFLQRYRPWSAQLWPDGTGELADVCCGDPWYEQPDGKNPGKSLVVARSQRGKGIIEGAIASGYVKLESAERWKLAKSQSGLLEKKRSIWGRQLALRRLGLPVTRFKGAELWYCWRRLTAKDKLISILGTLRRVFARKLYRPMRLDMANGVKVRGPV